MIFFSKEFQTADKVSDSTMQTLEQLYKGWPIPSLPLSSRFEFGDSEKKNKIVMQETVKVGESMEKINISPFEVALIVDDYLCANNLFQTRATFRMEASSLFAASPLIQLSNTSADYNLDKILADYICLRRQKIILDQEMCAITQEKYRVQKLLDDMHNAVNTYNVFLSPIPMNVSSGVCTATTAYVQNTCNVLSQQSTKRKNSEAEPTIAKRPRGRPPGKKNQFRALNTLPLSRTQPQSTNSSILETQTTKQFFQPAVTCNENVVSHCQNSKVMVDPEKEITYKDSLHISPINSDTNKQYIASPIPQSLENSIPNEVSTLHKETQNHQSDMNLSSIDFDLDVGYWSNLSFEDKKFLDGLFSDYQPPSTHSEGNA
ncbi:hypothetical protein ACSQ67_016188 [Phaseolus vulgaris]